MVSWGEALVFQPKTPQGVKDHTEHLSLHGPKPLAISPCIIQALAFGRDVLASKGVPQKLPAVSLTTQSPKQV